MLRSTLLAVSLCLSGCVVGPVGNGSISAAWQLQTSAGQPVACLPGETVSLFAGALRYDFDCAQGAGTTGPLQPGTYAVQLVLNTVDATSPITIAQTAVVYSGAVTDLGLIIFTVQTAPLGSATFTWFLHQDSLTAPPEGCQPGETIQFQITGEAPFVVDCFSYGSQPVEGLPAGTYNATLTLLFNGVPEPDPRPGFGVAAVTTTFQVFAGQDTPIQVDFVVSSAPARETRPLVTQRATPIHLNHR